MRTDRDIDGPGSLIGRTIGVPGYRMTAALWVRGMLSDNHGVAASSVRWRADGLKRPGRKEKFGWGFGDVEVVPVRDNETLSPMLAAGEIDRLISMRVPSYCQAALQR